MQKFIYSYSYRYSYYMFPYIHVKLALLYSILNCGSNVCYDRWRQNGRSMVPKKDPQYCKVHFAMMTPDGTSNAFLKFVYKRLTEKNSQRVIVHYVGDDCAYTAFPCGMQAFKLLV